MPRPERRRKKFFRRWTRRLLILMAGLAVVFYLWRDSLIFPRLARFVEDQVFLETGVQIRIGSMSGSLYDALEFHDLELLAAPSWGVLRKLQCGKLRIEYSLAQIDRVLLVDPVVIVDLPPMSQWEDKGGGFLPELDLPTLPPIIDVANADVIVTYFWETDEGLVPDSVVVTSARVFCDQRIIQAMSPHVEAAIVPDGAVRLTGKHQEWGFHDLQIFHDEGHLASANCDLSNFPLGTMNFTIVPQLHPFTALKVFAIIDQDSLHGRIVAENADFGQLPPWFRVPDIEMLGQFSGLGRFRTNDKVTQAWLQGVWQDPTLGVIELDSAHVDLFFEEGDLHFQSLQAYRGTSQLDARSAFFDADDGWLGLLSTLSIEEFRASTANLDELFPEGARLPTVADSLPVAVRVAGHIDEGALILSEGRLSWDQREAHSTVAYLFIQPDEPGASHIDAELEIEAGTLESYLERTGVRLPLRANIDGVAHLRGTIVEPLLELKLKAPDLRADEHHGTAGLHAFVDRQGVRVKKLDLKVNEDQLELYAEGLLDFGADSLGLVVDGSVQPGHCSQEGFDNRMTIDGELTGSISEPRLTAQLNASRPQIGSWQLDTLAVEVKSQGARLELDAWLFEPRASMRLDAVCADVTADSLGFQLRELVVRNGAEEHRAHDVALGLGGARLELPFLLLEGDSSRVILSGGWNYGSEAEASLDAQRIDVSGLLVPWFDGPLPELRFDELSSTLRLDSLGLAFHNLFARSRQARLAASGRIDYDTGVVAGIQASSVDLTRFLAPLAPNLPTVELQSLSGRLSGKLRSPDGSFRVQALLPLGDSLHVACNGLVETGEQKLRVPACDVQINGVLVGSVRGQIPLAMLQGGPQVAELDVEIDVSAESLQLAELAGIWEAGKLRGKLHYGRAARGVGLSGWLSGQNCKLGPEDWAQRYNFELELQPDRVGHQTRMWLGRRALENLTDTLLVASGRVPWSMVPEPGWLPGGEFDMRFASRILHPGLVPAALSDSLWVGGRLRFEGTLHGRPEAPVFDLKAELENLHLQSGAITELGGQLWAHAELPGQVDVDLRGVLGPFACMAELDFSADGDAGASLLSPAAWRLDSEIRGWADELFGLSALFPKRLRYAQGSASFNLSSHGRLDQLETAGRAWVRDATLKTVAEFPAIENLDLELALQEDSLRIVTGRGNLGGSPFILRGGIANADDPRFDLALDGDNLLLYRDEEVNTRGDVRLRVRGPYSALQIGDSVYLRYGRITRNLVGNPLEALLETGLQRSTPQRLAMRTGPLSTASYDLTLITEEPVLIQTVLFRGQLSTSSLRLRGTGQNPWLEGILTIDNADYFLPTTVVRGEIGQLAFSAERPFDPELTIQGRSRILNYQVELRVVGNLSSPQLAINTLPPMSDNEARAFLLTGRPPTDVRGGAFDNRRAAAFGNVAVFVARDYFVKSLSSSNEWENFWREILERIEIEVGGGSVEESYIEVGLPIAEDVIFDEDRLYIVGERSSLGSINGGLKIVFRIP